MSQLSTHEIPFDLFANEMSDLRCFVELLRLIDHRAWIETVASTETIPNEMWHKKTEGLNEIDER